jgi:glucokinase
MTGEDILVADIGGTNARFAIASRAGGRYRLAEQVRFSADAFPQFALALGAYIERLGARPRRACFAVAGPIEGGAAQLTNSPWRLSQREIETRFGFAQVALVNDFAGQARGAPMLAPEERAVIAPGHSVDGAPIVVLGPGTGLGLALLVPTGSGFRVLPTEGGHTAFAPQTDLERRVQAQLQSRFGYVSYERVCSGVGLEAVYQALSDIAGRDLPALDAAEIALRRDTDDLARTAFDIFFSALGVFAGNAILASGGRGGLFLSGGILPKNRSPLSASTFLESVRARGPMSKYLADVPIWLALSEETALIGAAGLIDDLGNG